jgi:hypothetical protein
MCGFDIDRQGAVGEIPDDCQVCDGTMADPDGDANTEDLICVDYNA